MSVIILKHSILFISKIYCTCTFRPKQIKFHKQLHPLSLSCRLSFVNFIVLLGYVLFRQFTNNTYFLHVNIKAAVDRATKMYWIKKETGEEIAMTSWSEYCIPQRHKLYYYTLHSLPVFSLAKTLQLILEISTTYRLVSYLLASNWLICRCRSIAWFPVTIWIQVPCTVLFVVIFFEAMYNKTIIYH